MTPDEFAVPEKPEALAARLGPAHHVDLMDPTSRSVSLPSFAYLDCGAWMGDGRHVAAQRSFAVVCGQHAVLCDFQAGRGTPGERQEGPAAQAITRLLAALAGPQRMDVTVRRWFVARSIPTLDDDRLMVFLPDMHLPLVGKMPDLDPDLVPDPRLARCWCHGPIFARIDGTAGRKPVYRAVGSRLTRSPNDWFYALASSYQPAAEDLVRFLDRLARHGVNAPIHLVHLGGLFDVWAGYKCVFHSMGFAGLVEPRIVADAGEREFLDQWRDATLDGRSKDALARLYRIAPEKRTLLAAAHGHTSDAATPPNLTFRPSPHPELQTSLRTKTVYAENRPRGMGCCVDRPPHALIGMLEGKAQYFPWTRVRPQGWRRELIEAATARWAEQPFTAYVMAHTHVPCLAEITVDLEGAS